MYGMVNKAIADLVINNYGQEKWFEILEISKIENEVFIGMESYPDEMTYTLVGAASQVLNLSPEQVLESFGEYWISYTALEGYGDLLSLAGNTLPEFLKNLDQLHSSVGHIMPRLQPPSFHCSEIKEKSLKLHHYTHRANLEYMVVGLLKGLGKRFNSPCTVTTLETKTTGSDHNSFLIEWK